MAELDLARVDGEQDLYAIEGRGTLRVESGKHRSVVITTDANEWTVRRKGLWSKRIVATSAAGGAGGESGAKEDSSNTALVWAGQRMDLSRAGFWNARHQLSLDGRTLLELGASAGGRRPVRMTQHADELPPELLLFTAYVVLEFATQSRSTSARSVRRAGAGVASGSGLGMGVFAGGTGGGSDSGGGSGGGGGCGGGGCGGGS